MEGIMENDLKANRNHKDSVFTDYFNDAKMLIELYNAIEGTDYPEDTQLEINTLQGVLFRGINNDISFTLGGKLVILLEGQSSPNKNMPLRLLMYIGRVYEKIVDNKAVYNNALVKIPKPEFIVIYNGKEDLPERQTLKLSDAFEDVETKELLELTVSVYNVNSGYNADILERCKPLDDYSTFTARIRKNESEGMSLDDAIVESIEYCISNGIMRDYLEANGSEVRNMLFTEYNAEDDKQASFDEGKLEGVAEGKAEGEATGKVAVARNMKAKNYPIADISEITGLSFEEIEKL
jgi:hypothetical protein